MKEYNVRVRYVKEADFYVRLEAENDDEAIKNAADPYYIEEDAYGEPELVETPEIVECHPIYDNE